MKHKKNSPAKIILGITCLIIGIIGGFTPIFQGWVFILLGITILFGKRFLKKFKK